MNSRSFLLVALVLLLIVLGRLTPEPTPPIRYAAAEPVKPIQATFEPRPEDIPPVLPVVPPTPPAPVVLTISFPELHPDYVIGDMIHVRTRTTGQVVGIKWHINGPITVVDDGGKVMIEDGKDIEFMQAATDHIVFATRQPGWYRVTAAAVTADYQQDQCERLIELVSGVIDPPPPKMVADPVEVAPPVAVEPPKTVEVPPMPMPEEREETLTLPEVVVRLASQVRSPRRTNEAEVLSGCYVGVSRRIRTKILAEGSRPLDIVRREAAISLGDAASQWIPFFQGLSEHFIKLQASGVTWTETNYAVAFEQIALALSNLK